MRLDKYLKVSRIIKRRTVAKEACDQGRIVLNGRVAKAGSEVKEGDIIEIRLGQRMIKAQITSVQDHVKKEQSKNMYEILEGEEDQE